MSAGSSTYGPGAAGPERLAIHLVFPVCRNAAAAPLPPQVLFHVATMMPTVDERCNNKKMHIGNDFVLIVYNESGQEFSITSIRAQFCYAGVVVEPLDHGTNRIVVNTKGKLQVRAETEPLASTVAALWRESR